MTGRNRLHSAPRWIHGALVRPLVGVTAALVLWTGAGAVEPEDPTDDEKTFYYMGAALQQRLKPFALSDEELELVIRGLRAAHAGEPMEFERATYHEKLQTLGQQRMERTAEAEKVKSEAFLAEAAKRKGAVRNESGLIYTEITAGSGDSPESTDTVKVHYHGTLRDGTVFDSSVQRGSPFEFQLDRVIPCWSEGVRMMKVGGKSLFVCPPDLAYGERGSPPKIPGNAALSFEVELIEIK